MATSCWASTSSGLDGTRSASMAPVAHPLGDHGGLHQVAAVLGEDHAGGDRAHLVPGAAHPLQPGGHRGRRLHLDDQVDRAHVDAQLQAGGGDHGGQPAGLEVLLDLGALLLGDRAVVRAGEQRRRAPWPRPDCAMSSAGEWCLGQRALARWPARSAISLSRLHSRSARRRELAKTIVERCAWTRSAIRSSTCGQIEGSRRLARLVRSSVAGEPPSSPRSSTGTTTDRSNSLPDGGWTISTLRCGERKRATSSTGRTVADRPIRRAGRGPAARRAAPGTAPGGRRASCPRRRAPRPGSPSRRPPAPPAPRTSASGTATRGW